MQPFMQPFIQKRRIIGAIRFPAFLVIWSAGIVLLMGQHYPADASLIRNGSVASTHLDMQTRSGAEQPLAAIPSMKDYRALGSTLQLALETGDLTNGRWQPPESLLEPPIEQRPELDEVEFVPATIVPNKVEHKSSNVTFQKKPEVKSRVVVDPLANTKRAARVVLRSAEPTQAYALLMRDVGRAQADVEYLGLLAVAALQRQLYAEAAVVYRRLIELESGDERWAVGLALARSRLGSSPPGDIDGLASLAADGSPLQRLVATELRRT